jgi:hypothetical protein
MIRDLIRKKILREIRKKITKSLILIYNIYNIVYTYYYY